MWKKNCFVWHFRALKKKITELLLLETYFLLLALLKHFFTHFYISLFRFFIYYSFLVLFVFMLILIDCVAYFFYLWCFLCNITNTNSSQYKIYCSLYFFIFLYVYFFLVIILLCSVLLYSLVKFRCFFFYLFVRGLTLKRIHTTVTAKINYSHFSETWRKTESNILSLLSRDETRLKRDAKIPFF